LTFRLLGPLELSRGGDVLKLPASRKVRALLGYLVLASRPVARTQVCELLWDIPNDPRGELRWCLSKIRGLLDQDGRKRVIADGTSIRLDLTDCVVDTLEVTRAPEHGIQKLGVDRRRELAGLFKGELLEGLEIARSPMFDAWITAERRRFRGIHTVLLEHLSRDLPGEAAAPYVDEWLKLSPFDRSAHELLLTSLARQRRIAEGEAHLASASKLFESDGLDSAPLRDIWRRARESTAQQPAPGPTIELVSASLTEISQALGASYEISTSLSFGVELLHEFVLPEWRDDEKIRNVFVGPNVSYRRGHWFATVTALMQATDTPDEADFQIRTIFGIGL